MPDTIIRVENLSKQYRIGKRERYKALRDTLTDVLYAPVRGMRTVLQPANLRTCEPANENTIWALKDVSFEVKRGEVVGVIGRNGAGKSTLLKILSRITRPTEGQVRVRGRVGSLLEVGTGFHPELTGRENIYLNGAILGMKRAEIIRKFDEIVAFAEIEKFIDTSVKHYSSGMYMRLAFAVAAHLEPEILIVDEVLAVGDAQFQKKCLGKMGEVAQEGRTVLFVSHNMGAVQSLCMQAFWLDTGKIMGSGSTDSVITEYLQTTTTMCLEQVWSDIGSAPGNDRIKLHSIRIQMEDATLANQITLNTPFAIEIDYWNLKPNTCLNLSLALYNEAGICVFVTTTLQESRWHGQPFPVGLFRSICHIPESLLNDGIYRVVLRFVKDTSIVLFCYEEAAVFEVLDVGEGRGDWYGKWIGTVRPNLCWNTELVYSI